MSRFHALTTITLNVCTNPVLSLNTEKALTNMKTVLQLSIILMHIYYQSVDNSNSQAWLNPSLFGARDADVSGTNEKINCKKQCTELKQSSFTGFCLMFFLHQYLYLNVFMFAWDIIWPSEICLCLTHTW